MRIFNNFLYKLAAVVIAAVLWAATQGLRSDREAGFDLPVALEDVPEEVVVVEQSANEINVRVKGSRAALRRVERQLVRYPISLEGTKPGEARFTVDEARLRDGLPRGAEMAARSPSTIVVRLEPRIRRKVRINADIIGEPAPGYELVSVRVVPPEVELEGASSSLKRIREATTDRIDISGVERSEARDVRLILGAPHIWRAGGEEPIQVRIEVRPTAPEISDGEPALEEPDPGESNGDPEAPESTGAE